MYWKRQCEQIFDSETNMANKTTNANVQIQQHMRNSTWKVRGKRHGGANFWSWDKYDGCQRHDMRMCLTGVYDGFNIKTISFEDQRWWHSCQVWELRAQGCAMLVNFDGSGEKSSARWVDLQMMMTFSWLIFDRKFKFRFKEDYEKCLREQEKYFPNHLRYYIASEFTSHNLHTGII